MHLYWTWFIYFIQKKNKFNMNRDQYDYDDSDMFNSIKYGSTKPIKIPPPNNPFNPLLNNPIDDYIVLPSEPFKPCDTVPLPNPIRYPKPCPDPKQYPDLRPYPKQHPNPRAYPMPYPDIICKVPPGGSKDHPTYRF